MSILPSSLLLVGGGNMGEAMLAGWLRAGVDASSITVLDPSADRCATLEESYGVRTANNASSLIREWNVCILAIKPQIADKVVGSLAPHVSPQIIISVLAGTPIALFKKHFSHANCVRIMPNTPALIGEGAMVCVGAEAGSLTYETVNTLMSSCGSVFWLEDEQQIHAVTALSGSGPAYVFAMIEAMRDAAVTLGLSRALATSLAEQTVKGAGMMASTSTIDVSTLREHVTSPNGTTQAALDVLLHNGALSTLLRDALKSAATRSQELQSY